MSKPLGPAWGEEELKKLQGLLDEGRSIGGASTFMPGRSRNACIGAVHRHGLTQKGPVRKNVGARKRGKPSVPQVAGPAPLEIPAFLPKASRTFGTWGVNPSPQKALPFLPDDPTPPEGVPFCDLTDGCKWIFGNGVGRDVPACGKRQVTGRPYCAEHCRAAKSDVQIRRRYK